MFKRLALATVAAAAACFFLGYGTRAFADPPSGREHFSMTPFQAVLSPAQKRTLYTMIKADRAKLDSLHQRLHDAREALIEKLLSADSSVDVTKETADLKAAQAAMIDERVSIALAVRKLLSPQQLKDAAALHAKLEDLHRQESAILQQFQSFKSGPPAGGDE
jgi:imidazolonepropionase-like amidohydrolase